MMVTSWTVVEIFRISSRTTFAVRLLFINSTRTSKVPDRTLFIHSTSHCAWTVSQKSKGTNHYSWTVTVAVHQIVPRQNHSVYCLLSVEKKFTFSKSNSLPVIPAISWRIQGFLQLYKEPSAPFFNRFNSPQRSHFRSSLETYFRTSLSLQPLELVIRWPRFIFQFTLVTP